MPKSRSNGAKTSTPKTASGRSNASNYAKKEAAKSPNTRSVAKGRTNAATRKSKKA